MPQELVKGWLESQTAFETRKAEQVKKDTESFEASLKDGTVGRVVNDRADQIAVVKYRQEQAAKQKVRQAEVEVLKARIPAFQYPSLPLCFPAFFAFPSALESALRAFAPARSCFLLL